MLLLSFADATDLDEFALANENNTSDKDTTNVRRRRCFFMVIGGFSLLELQISEEKLE
jgi:hypothetical protein